MTARPTVVVDRDLCESNGICVVHAPHVFEIGDDDKLRLLVLNPSATEMRAVRMAVAACPKGALSIEGDTDP